ncbi:MAG: hypothetical protein FJX68_14665 [Alphaproteobacteria bacterium]|nr:hypothetical protein [Alphaproteobacteria bacterium]
MLPPLKQSLEAHGYWLARFPSRFFSANNHLIAEAGALYLLGQQPGASPQALRRGQRARAVLLTQAQRQFHEDGVGAEQSPTYASFSLEWLLLAAVVGERTGQPFPPSFWQRLEQGVLAQSARYARRLAAHRG